MTSKKDKQSYVLFGGGGSLGIGQTVRSKTNPQQKIIGERGVGCHQGYRGKGAGYPVTEKQGGRFSFELKPKAIQQDVVSKEKDNTVDDISWTYSRNQLPPLFIQQESSRRNDDGSGVVVTIEQWQETFDNVVRLYKKIDKRVKNLSCLIFVPCFICCTYPRLRNLKERMDNMWLDLAEKEQRKYQPMGIEVTVAIELCGRGWVHNNSSRNLLREGVGLHFDVSNSPLLISDTLT